MTSSWGCRKSCLNKDVNSRRYKSLPEFSKMRVELIAGNGFKSCYKDTA